MRFILPIIALVIAVLAQPARALEECNFGFEVDTQSSALQALVDDIQRQGGFWRPIAEAPDDVRKVAKHVGRLDICLMTPDGEPRQMVRNGVTHTVRSPLITHCTAALLPGNRLLTNHHCFYEPKLVAAGFTVVREARVNFGYTDRDVTAQVQTFLVGNREVAAARELDALVLQVLGGDANAATGGHVPMDMQTAFTPRRAMTMIHHPNGAPQQYSTGTCQVHRRQAEVSETASNLRHTCETSFGSSGSLLLDARNLRVMGLHNQGGLGPQGGFNGAHKITSIEEALKIGFTIEAPPPPPPPLPPPPEPEPDAVAGPAPGPVVDATPAPPDPQAGAALALTDALLERDPLARRSALEAILINFPGTAASVSATIALALIPDVPVQSGKGDQVAAPDPDKDAGRAPEPERVPVLHIVKPDGSADHTSIAEAVAAAGAGDRIEVHPGRYGGAVTVTEPIEIVGVGDRAQILWGGKDAILIDWQAAGGRIANLALRHEAARLPGLRIRGGAVLLEGNDMSARGGAAMIEISASASPVIRDNLLHDGGGIVVRDGGLGTIEDNVFFRTATDALRIETRADPLVRNNRIRDSQGRGVVIFSGGKGRLFGNTITGARLAGVEVSTGAAPVLLRNAILEGEDVGILVQQGGKGRFEGNEISGSGSAGIAIQSRADPLFRRNRILKGEGFGVAVFNQGRGVFEDNRITNNKSAGFVIAGQGRPRLVRNVISDNQGFGVWIFDEGRGEIVGNDLRGNTRAGLRVDDSAGAVVDRNNQG